MRLVALVVIAACGSSGPPLQGKVTGQVIDCGDDCGGALRGYFAQHAGDRIAGIDQIYGDPKPQLIAWISESDAWPAARDLSIDTIACDPSADVPDCAAAITEGIRRDHEAKHAFLVPLVGPAPRVGTWSLLDVRRTSGSSASWSTVRVVSLPCRVERGDKLYNDVGRGVVMASFTLQTDSALESPGICEPALINYLRAHPEERIAGVVPVVGTPAHSTKIDFPGTASLVILVGDAPWPRADELSISLVSCSEPSCARHFADVHPQLHVTERALFIAPMTVTLDHPTRSDELLVVSKLR